MMGMDNDGGVPDELQTLIERRNWLAARIKAKESVGWEPQYDEREHRALCWAIGELVLVRERKPM